MAKVREIKKEVNFLTNEIIDDCNSFMVYHSDKADDGIKLIEEVVALRNNLIQKINHPDSKSNKFFKEVQTQLVTESDVIYEKLRKLIK